MDKLLSIIVPSYNMEKYLPKCLGSMLIDDAELFQRLDVIVVNDGSKDRTSEIGHDFERRYPGVFRVIDKTNGNYGSCTNAALPLARGRYVKVVDADDSVDKVSLRQFLDVLAEESACGENAAEVIISDFVVVNENDDITDKVRYCLPETCHALDDVPANTRRFETQAVTYRTDVPQRICYRQTEGISYTDVEWDLIPMSSVTSLRYVNLPVVRYLVGRNGQTMEVKTYMAKYNVVVDIMFNIISWYHQHPDSLSANASAYCRRMIYRIAEQIYHGVFFGRNGVKSHIDIQSFDKKLRAVDERIYHSLEETRCEFFRHEFFYVQLLHDRSLVGRIRWLAFVVLIFLYQKIDLPLRKLIS